jgi:hypothetical protein
MRYECPAGENLLWASSENKEFLKCNLKAGGTYMVLVKVTAGAFRNGVGLEPITADHKKFKEVKKLVKRKKPVVTPESKIQSTTKILEEKDYVNHIMKRYEEEWQFTGDTDIITQEMAIPIELLQ